MSLAEALKVSWVYKDGVKVGRRRGLKKGLEKGRKEGATKAKQEVLRAALATRFPEMGPVPQIESITQENVLDELLVAVFKAGNVDEVRAALGSVMRSS